MITLLEYGAGNLGSIQNMISRLGGEGLISKRPEDVQSASKIILPGVGHFDYGMENLNKSGVLSVLLEAVMGRKVPVLGICLGAQLMGMSSEEGNSSGLGWFNARAVKLSSRPGTTGARVPHMGWNTVQSVKSNPLTNGFFPDSRFYFAHSYCFSEANEEDIMFRTEYDGSFISGLHRDNIFAVQFHPEKSHKFGLKLLENFLQL